MPAIRARVVEHGQDGVSTRVLPAIAPTSRARVEDRLRSLTAGFEMYLPEPSAPAEPIAVVGALVSGSLAL